MTDQRMAREGLVHKCSTTTDHDFFELIDKTGGWPVGYKYVGFEHTTQRKAGFCNSPQNTGWWTVIANADDYFLWKLSPAALQRITDAVVSSIRPSRVDASKLYIKNWHGSNAARQSAAVTEPPK